MHRRLVLLGVLAFSSLSAAQDALQQATGPAYLGVRAEPHAAGRPGVWIAEVLAESPAALAGLEVGDLLLGINRQPLHHPDQLGPWLMLAAPGDALDLNLLRGGARLDVTVRLAQRPIPAAPERAPYESRRPTPDDPASDAWNESEFAWLGIETTFATGSDTAVYGLPTMRGALVVDVMPGSPADKAGLVPETLIIGINGNPIAHPEDLARRIALARPGDVILIDAYREYRRVQRRVTLGSRPLAVLLEDPLDADPWTTIEQLQRRVQELEQRLDTLHRSAPAGEVETR